MSLQSDFSSIGLQSLEISTPTEGSSFEDGTRPTSPKLSTSEGLKDSKKFPADRNWHLPNDWNWTGNSENSTDLVFESTSEFPGIEWSPSSGNVELGRSNAIVTRVICQSKILARKSEVINKKDQKLHLQEMTILKSLNHQHIIQVCGTYVVDLQYNCLLYPAAEMDLTAYMHVGRKDDSPNWVRTLISGMGCLCNALAYVHAAGISHKDIKPGNILVLGDVMILSDFGSANDFKNKEWGSKDTGTMGMTFLYAPPEVVNGEWHGRSVDVFSLGVVFGEMIEYIFYPWQLSSVEKRAKERKEGKRRPEWYEPEEMTFKEELFLGQWMEGKPEGGLIEQWEMQLLLKVMTAKERGKRPTAKEVWKFLRGREYDVTVGDGGVPATCGDCCL